MFRCVLSMLLAPIFVINAFLNRRQNLQKCSASQCLNYIFKLKIQTNLAFTVASLASGSVTRVYTVSSLPAW